MEEVDNVVLYADVDEDDEQKDQLLGGSIGCAVVDSGCTKSVCGNIWLNTYIDSLSQKERKLIYTENSICQFRFGIGKVYTSNRIVHIPVHIGASCASLAVHVVPCNIPLLLSRISLKQASATLNFEEDVLHIFGEVIPLIVTESGHYCLPLSRTIDEPHSPEIQKILFSTPIKEDDPTDVNRKKILKLHKQFSHPHPDKLQTLLKNAGNVSKETMDTVVDISKNCDVCKRCKHNPPRPAVSFPLATQFNETVALDLKIYRTGYMLHMIDHATRYSQACFIKNKLSATIVKSVLKFWVGVFGSPKNFLSDNGGEFVNQEFIELAEKFNIRVLTTAAESPWSNGLCEKHNGIIADMIQKTMSDGVTDLELAIHWCVAAKNSLQNVYGYTPNQLVFGRNLNFPNVIDDLPPAEMGVPISEYVVKNLQALHASRQSFIKQESCERLRRALARKTRNVTHFLQNDSVYYKRNNSNQWHGPARVLGKDSHQYLLKHGRIYVRVHPCRMQLTGTHCDPSRQNQSISDTTATPIDQQTDDSDDEVLPPRMPNPPTPPATPTMPEVQDEEEPRINREQNSDNNDDSSSDDRDNIRTLDDTADPLPATDKDASVTKITSVKTSKDLPQPKMTITYRSMPDREWKDVHVVSKAGKTTTKNWHFLNIRPVGEEDAMCVSFKSVKWKPAQETEVVEFVYYGSADVRFLAEKSDEMQKWRDMDVYEEVKNVGQPWISSRWVLTEKMKGGAMVRKARLCVRGCEEDQSQMKTDSPTCQKESLRLLLCVLASKQWTLHSMDIKSAYLQGMPLTREVYMMPPKEADTQNLWCLKKCPYRLADAGRRWYIKVEEELIALGAHQPKLDQAMFAWHDDNKCIGLMAIHVDDFIYGGTDAFLKTIIPRLKSIFKIGLEESSMMKYLGTVINQNTQGIKITTDPYSDSLKEIHDTGSMKGRNLDQQETKSLRHLSGQLNWIVTQTRPDIAYENCIIGNSISTATVREIHLANKTVRKVKTHNVSLNFPSKFNLQSSRIVGYTDASFGNLPDCGSQGDHVIFLCDNQGSYVLMTWQSRKIRRATNSTLAAECIAAVETAESCFHLQTLIQELLDKGNDSQKVPIHIFCDNRSLWYGNCLFDKIKSTLKNNSKYMISES